MNADHAERVDELCGVIGSAILSALNNVDKAGLLKKDSQIKDLGLVMALFIRNADSAAGIGDLDSSCMEPIIQYAKKAEIDLLDSGVKGLEDRIGSYEVEALEGDAKPSRWDWSKKVSIVDGRLRASPY